MKTNVKIYLDSETCGLHGVPVLFQYAVEDGPVLMYDIWKNPVEDTLRLIEYFCENTVVMFNSAFDWFHVNKIYNIFRLLPPGLPSIAEAHKVEMQARDGVCVKPKHTLDIFLHARKTKYQSTMERSDIRIRKVPIQLGNLLANELERRVPLNTIYFARKADPYAPQWQVTEHKDSATEVVLKDWCDVVLKFAPSSALKALAVDALGINPNEILKFGDVEVSKKLRPEEAGWAPFANAVPGEHTWPYVLIHHINHWAYNTLARKYAELDVIYLRDLDKYFEYPEPDDTDSVLACSVAAVRWKGFNANIPEIAELIKEALKVSESAPKAPRNVMRYITEDLSQTEKTVLLSTKKTVLEEISSWDHPAAKKAQAVLDARKATKEVELYEKLLQAGRFHASYKVLGTLSGRMSGADKLNPQGIKKTKKVRGCFPLAFPGEFLTGGDFESFEVVLAEAEYKDENLRRDLLSGKSIHGLFGQNVFTDMDYDQILATKKTEDDRYTKSKSAVFAMLYGGEGHTLKNRLGVDLETAEEAYQRFIEQYPGVGIARRKVFNDFCSMTQPGGIGTRVVWKEPKDYVESMLGFKRYFTLENKICKALFDLANDIPDDFKKLEIKVVRRDRVQTGAGAIASALYGAAFAIQAANMRAAANHRIQSTGAEITKILQRKIWDLQPCGIHAWLVRPMNVHDEVNTVCATRKLIDKIIEIKDKILDMYRDLVPLIGLDWNKEMTTWAD